MYIYKFIFQKFYKLKQSFLNTEHDIVIFVNLILFITTFTTITSNINILLHHTMFNYINIFWYFCSDFAKNYN